MQTRGILVDYRAVNSAMSACTKAQKWDMVMKLYDQMPTVTGHTYVPNQFSYSQALNAACKLKNPTRPLEILWAKRDAGIVPSTAAVSQVIATLEGCEKNSEAVTVFEEFISQHLSVQVREQKYRRLQNHECFSCDVTLFHSGTHSITPLYTEYLDSITTFRRMVRICRCLRWS
jgi:pentatricopeptide repeat protein